MRPRWYKVLVGVLLALLLGGGAGVAGWIVEGVLGAIVCASIGAFLGLSVAPDVARYYCRQKARSRSCR